MKIIHVSNIEAFTAKFGSNCFQNTSLVQSILTDVQKNGDKAVKKYEKKFSKANLITLRVSQQEISDAYTQVTKDQIQAIKTTKNRLQKTESSIKSLLKSKVIKIDGTTISKKFLPIQSVGCYVPGGLAKYPSSVIMSVVPARVAGVKNIVVVSPPKSDGKIDPLTVVAANICGARQIYKTGGAQAIAALSYGTKSIPKVDKIVGPGGSFVTTAKSLVGVHTAIDMLAGPTELGILADSSSNPKFIALDLISQAEHSKDTLCYLITNSQKLAKSVNTIISEFIPKISRQDFVKPSLEKNGFIAVCDNKSDMIRLANNLAPEHLQVMTSNSKEISSNITTPGLILLGNETPSSASDYLLGSNHILPTNRFGRTRGSLSVLDFIKLTTYVRTTKSSLKKISKDLEILTSAEGLPNHFEAARSRLE